MFSFSFLLFFGVGLVFYCELIIKLVSGKWYPLLGNGSDWCEIVNLNIDLQISLLYKIEHSKIVRWI
jgi:hypothetical protein